MGVSLDGFFWVPVHADLGVRVPSVSATVWTHPPGLPPSQPRLQPLNGGELGGQRSDHVAKLGGMRRFWRVDSPQCAQASAQLVASVGERLLMRRPVQQREFGHAERPANG